MHSLANVFISLAGLGAGIGLNPRAWFSGVGVNPTKDVLLLFAFFAAALFYGLSVGRRRIASSIIYLYVASALLPIVPIESLARSLGVRELWRAEIAAFFILFGLLFFLLGRGRLFGFPSGRRWWQVFILTMLSAGLLIHVALGFLPNALRSGLAPLTQRVFANPEWTLGWYAAPLLALIFIRWMEGWDE